MYFEFKHKYKRIITLLKDYQVGVNIVTSESADQEETVPSLPLLYKAVLSGDADTIRHILAHSLISVNARGNLDMTPLYSVAGFSKPNYASILLACSGVNTNAQNINAQTHITICCIVLCCGGYVITAEAGKCERECTPSQLPHCTALGSKE